MLPNSAKECRESIKDGDLVEVARSMSIFAINLMRWDLPFHAKIRWAIYSIYVIRYDEVTQHLITDLVFTICMTYGR